MKGTERLPSLDEETVPRDPFALFALWLAAATGIAEPEAMALATVNANGSPAARMVLLRGVDERGFVFFTNYGSAKGRDLATNERVAAVFYWGPLGRQVRIEGTVARVETEESDAYFARRPRGHQLSAWASAQSSVVSDRSALERNVAEAERRFSGKDVPRPPHWGGYRISPERIEFWQHRADRLHDRILYTRTNNGWQKSRLSP
ncbi:MAG: pyridoxamine 5'-phosphate oxidase [Candidatus Eremiobacteraeota bacterium]|nr:pyridoxamine 5'-phosphate oxidase [Candidatus Eremiobacteraeota bacterium]